MNLKVERQVVRHRIKVEALEVNESPGTGTYILDLSPLGMRLETPIPFAKMDLVSIKFQLPGETEEMLVGGKVMWIRPMVTPPPRFLMGLKLFVPQWQLDLLGRQWRGYKQAE